MPKIIQSSPDPYRVRFAKIAPWNIQPTVTDDHRLFRFLPQFAGWTPAQHEARSRRWRDIGKRLDAVHADLTPKALTTYGAEGSYITGIVRSHFPEPIKNRLRQAAHGATEAYRRSMAHWRAAGRQTKTWRTL